MNGNIGTLTIEMAANVARLQQGMDRAKGIVGRSVGQIRNLVSGMFTGMFAAISVSELSRAADAISNMDARLRLATKSQAEFVKAQGDIRRISESTKGSLEATANLYTRIAQSLPDTINRQRKAADTSHALALSLRISGATAEESASAMHQFSQAIASGVLRGEEFNSVNEAAPRVMKALADAIGVPVGQLREMATQGKLTRDILVEGLGSQLPKLLQEAATLPDTIGTSWQAVRNELLLTVGEIDKITGASSLAAKAIGMMAGGLRNLRDIFSPSEAQKIATRLNYLRDSMDSILLRRNLLGKVGINSSRFWGDELEKLNSEALTLQRRLAEIQEVAQAEGPLVDPEAGIKNLLAEAEAKAKAAEAAKEAEKTAKAAIAAAQASEKAANDYIISLHRETEEIGLNSIQVKLLAASRSAANAPLESQRMAIMASAQAWAEMTQAQEASAAAARSLEAEEKKRLDGYTALVQADEKALESLRQKNDLLEYGASAIAQMGQADLQAALDRAWAADNIDINVIAMLERRLELSKKLADETKRGEALEAAREAAKEANVAWQNASRDINRSLTDALLRGFESGKGFARNLRDTVMNMFQTMILRPVISAVLAPMTGGMAGMLPGAAGAVGPAGAAGGMGAMNMLSSGSSLMSMMGSGIQGMVSGLGSMFGSSALSAFGAGMGMTGAQAGLAAGAYGAAGMAGTGSMISAGAAFAPFAGPLAVAAIADMGLKMLAGDRSMSENGAWKAISSIPIVGLLPNLLNAFFGTTPKKLGPAELTGDFAQDGFRGEFQADWTRKVGLFGGKKRGRRGLGIEDEQVEGLNSMLFGITDSFKDFISFVGAGQRSLDGWTFSVKQQIETEEQQAQLAIDVANSLGAHLIPELVALQQEGEEIVATLGRVRAEFVLVDQMLDLTGQTLNKAGIASLALRDSLVQAMGGLQGAGALLQPFFEGFYTEAERAASTGRLMNAELGRLGITTIPATREQFRALVEAQDLNTDSGQQMFAALLRLAPAFATVTDAIGQAAADAEAEAKRIRDSMQLLTTDSFATKFEYERYLRLAANAGVTAAQPAPLFEAPPAQVFPSFAVGTNFLPQDMTINAHAGERIIPAADNSELMQRLREPNESAQVMAEEIRQLRAELKAAHLAIARNTANTAKILSRWDGDGVPEERVIT